MIFVDRKEVPRPKWFGSPEWGQAMLQLHNHTQTKASFRAQKRSASVINSWPKEVNAAVSRLFRDRCAMCESEIAKGSFLYLRQFRPVVTEESKDRFEYAYAALLWENLILLCHDCDKARGDRFERDSPSRSTSSLFDIEILFARAAGGIGEVYKRLNTRLQKAITNERSWQIDPTYDPPEEFVHFDDKGVATPAPSSDQYSRMRSKHTIEIFKLNRDNLVSRRHKSIMTLKSFLGKGMTPTRSSVKPEDYQRIVAAYSAAGRFLYDAEYQACVGFELARWLHQWVIGPIDQFRILFTRPEEHRHFERVFLPIWKSLYGERKSSTVATDPQKSSQKVTRSGELSATAHAPSGPRYSRSRATRVRLKNFRQFKSAEFSLPRDRPEDAFGADHELRNEIRRLRLDGRTPPPEPDAYGGWKMLLGENGVGKSSILQAIALALHVDETGTKPPVDLCDLRRSVYHGAESGSIEVWLEDRKKPVTIRFSPSKIAVTGTAANAKTAASIRDRSPLFLRAYGAARLLPPFGAANVTQETAVTLPQDVRNLFDSYHPLTDPNRWLPALDEESRHMAFITLHDLLDLPDDVLLEIQDWQGRRTLGFKQSSRFTPLEHFSAGYQSVVALACDIMAGFGGQVGDMQKHVGVVLLDEIGTNLHPRWRLRIVQALRRAFPLLQFVASTHEPLCLRGLGKGEVALLTLDDADDNGNKEVLLRDDDLPSPAIYRVDQLLTGDFFGLQTAYDPDEEAAFDAYHWLLVQQRDLASHGATLTPEQDGLLTRLRERLKNRLVLGATVTERRVLDALDQAALQQPEDTMPGKREPLKGSAQAKQAAQRLLQSLPGEARKSITPP